MGGGGKGSRTVSEMTQQDEVMDYFTRMVIESSKEFDMGGDEVGNPDDIVITNSFGLIEKTVLNGAPLPIPEEIEGEEQQERLT